VQNAEAKEQLRNRARKMIAAPIVKIHCALRKTIPSFT
jgi:hypothetical protein